jgi:Ni/Co efflux regulator RcnB
MLKKLALIAAVLFAATTFSTPAAAAGHRHAAKHGHKQAHKHVKHAKHHPAKRHGHRHHRT